MQIKMAMTCHYPARRQRKQWRVKGREDGELRRALSQTAEGVSRLSYLENGSMVKRKVRHTPVLVSQQL